MRSYVESHYGKTARAETSATEFVGRTGGFYREARTLDVISLEKADDFEVVAQVRSTLTGQWYRVGVKVATVPPNDIVSFSRSVIPPPPQVAAHSVRSEQEIADEVGALLDKMTAADMFSGVALVTKDDRPIFEKAYGLASKDPAVPNRLNTQFNLASITKIFTGVAIAQLAEQGKLSFSDTISKHLPDYPNQEVARKVTIHQMLTHTSGLGNILTTPAVVAMSDLSPPREYFPLFANDPLAFEPGEGVQYSNAAFIILGAIIERASGQSYGDYLHEHIFAPAGMGQTDFRGRDELRAPRRATNYAFADLRGQDDLLVRRSHRPLSGASAGGGYSTVGDLHKFWVALREHRLLHEADTKFVMAGKAATRQGEDVKHAYGFEDELVNGHRIVGHGGGGRGVNTQFDIYVDDGYTVIILSNYDPLAATAVANKLREILT